MRNETKKVREFKCVEGVTWMRCGNSGFWVVVAYDRSADVADAVKVMHALSEDWSGWSKVGGIEGVDSLDSKDLADICLAWLDDHKGSENTELLERFYSEIYKSSPDNPEHYEGMVDLIGRDRILKVSSWYQEEGK